MSKSTKIILIIAAALIAGLGGYKIYTDTVHMNGIKAVYKEALHLIDDDNYSDAFDLLESISSENYKDTLELMSLCNAHIEYDAGEIERPYFTMGDLNLKNQEEWRMNKVDKFKDAVDQRYYDYCEMKRKEEEAKKEQEYRDSVRNGVPFVGMKESDIARTSLGRPSPETRGNTECIGGEIYHATLYDFLDSDGKVIFTARCIQGKVTEVWDERDNPRNPHGFGNSGSSSSGSSGKKDDPYDVYDYNDPEDFYEDNYDDFEDIEDAEDYWDEAWGY